MSSCVLDSSAVIAVMSNEPDSAAIIEECSGALISAVNVAEIYSKTSDVGITSEEIDWAIDQLQIRPIVCDLDQARVSWRNRGSAWTCVCLGALQQGKRSLAMM
mgnify:CR=1 FL=1